MRNRFLFFSVALVCSFFNPVRSSSADDEYTTKGYEGDDEYTEEEYTESVPKRHCPDRRSLSSTLKAQPFQLCQGELAKRLIDPHYVLSFKPVHEKHFMNAQEREVYEASFTAVQHITPSYPIHYCQPTTLSPLSKSLVFLIADETSKNLPQEMQKKLRCLIFDYFHSDTKTTLANANFIINTNYGLMPLLSFVIRSIRYDAILPNGQILSDDYITIIRIIAEKSSDKIRTLVLNDEEARKRINATPKLKNFLKLTMTKICDCSLEEEKSN